ncbi:MAG TPA: hypothetical protein VKB80_08510 [Kofleriaceae bacterium]|nr:hypothetical protein [Kofleriaceae bacterium]
MNFFGHALVASWRSGEPAFALGAMLPDFASMCGMRLEAALHDEAAAGVACHHATDRVFHRLEPFARAVADISRRLIARGVARGPARGVAHVGFELCLDGELLDEGGAAAAYRDALAAGGEAGVEGALRWSAPDGPARWRQLCARLAAHGLPVEYRDPARVAERVERILARRPLLALSPAGAAIVMREMPAVAERVARAAPRLLEELRAELAA